jgi:hypothetical protein
MDQVISLTNDQADDLIALCGGLVTAIGTAAEEFCQRHGKMEPQAVGVTVLMMAEVTLEGILLTAFAERDRVPLMRQISHSVQNTLRERAKKEVRGHA